MILIILHRFIQPKQERYITLWSDWENIYSIKSKEVELGTYQYIDNDAEYGTNYYRLKQVMNNGTIDYSSVINLTITKLTAKPLIYPNPSKGNVNISYSVAGKDANASLQIYNSVGQIVLEKELETNVGVHSIGIDLNRFDSDMYYFKMIIDHELYIEKVLIRR